MRKPALHMNEDTSFQDLQDEFSSEYPFLKINFLRPVKNNAGWVIKMERVLAIDHIGAYLRTIIIKTVEMQPERTVRQLIEEVENNLYVKANIQRKSGGLWIATSLTADWSLEHQNREGKFLSQ